MIFLLGERIGFWIGLVAGVFILLHLPSCDYHWVNKFSKLSRFFKKHHLFTLRLATIFALIHIVLAIIGLIFNIWI